MEIIKPKYSTEELVAIYNEYSQKVDKEYLRKIPIIATIITAAPHVVWGILLIFGVLMEIPILTTLSLVFAIIGGISFSFGQQIVNFLVEHYLKKGIRLFNPLDATDFSKYTLYVLCSETFEAWQKDGEVLTLLTKGDDKVLLSTSKEGTETVHSLPEEMRFEKENTLDFSFCDEALDNILKALEALPNN